MLLAARRPGLQGCCWADEAISAVRKKQEMSLHVLMKTLKDPTAPLGAYF